MLIMLTNNSLFLIVFVLSILHLSQHCCFTVLFISIGGTADITVHEKISNGHLKELCHASGGDCGGTSIDNGFIQMIVKIIGAPMISLLKQEDPTAYLDLLREFETVKRKIETDTTKKVNFTIPFATINSLCESRQSETFVL